MQQPKQPVGGAYGIWLQEQRATLSKEMRPRDGHGALLKLAGARWRSLSESEKAPYVRKYSEKVCTYQQELEAFVEAGGVVKDPKPKKRGKGGGAQEGGEEPKKPGKGKGKRRKQVEEAETPAEKPKMPRKKARKKDPDEPKRPVGGAFGCFSEQHRHEFVKESGSKGGTAVMRVAGERWKAMTPEERKPFEKMYQEKYNQFLKDMAAYTARQKAASKREEESSKESSSASEEEKSDDKEEEPPGKPLKESSSASEEEEDSDE